MNQFLKAFFKEQNKTKQGQRKAWHIPQPKKFIW